MKTITSVIKGFRPHLFLNPSAENNLLDFFSKKKQAINITKSSNSNRQFFLWLITNITTGLIIYLMLFLAIFF